MSASVDPQASGKYVDFPEYVDFQLRKARQQIRSTDLLTAGTVSAVLVIGYLLLFIVADQWLFAGGLPRVVRWIGLVGWLAVLGGWIVWRMAVPLLRSVTGLFAAKEVERSEPELRSNLLNWVDLQQAGRTVDPGVLRAIERQAAVQLSKMDVSKAIDHRPLLRSAYALLAVVVLFCIYAIVTPKKIGPSLARVLPMSEVLPPTRTEIRAVNPGDIQVTAGATQEVTVDLAGVIPPEVKIAFSTDDRKYVDELVAMQSEGVAGTRFRALLVGEGGQGLRQGLSYRVEAGDAVSATYHIRVDQPPSAQIDEIRIDPPAYTGLPSETLAKGDISGWEGSTVTVSATVNVPVTSAKIEFVQESNGKPTGEEVKVAIRDGLKLTATWQLAMREDGTFPNYYQIQCETADQRNDPRPVQHPYSIRRDHPPTIALLAPERDLEVPANAVIPLLAQAADDFELGPVTMEIQQAGKTIARETLSPGRQKSLRVQHDLALKPLALKPGDEITYWLAAQDNRQPRRNTRQTPPLKIRILAPTEDRKIQEQLAEEKARQQEQLAQLDQSNIDREMNRERENEIPEDGVREGSEPPMPPELQPGEQPPKEDSASDDQQGTNGSATGNDGEKGPNGKESGPKNGGQKGGAGEQSQEGESPPLSPDGEDDQQVLERLLQKQPPSAGSAKPGSQGPKGTNPEQRPPQADPEPNSTPDGKPDRPKSAQDQPGNGGDKPKQPGQQGADPQQPASGAGKSAKSKTGMPPNPDKPAVEPKEDPSADNPDKEQPGPNGTPKAGDKPGEPEKTALKEGTPTSKPEPGTSPQPSTGEKPEPGVKPDADGQPQPMPNPAGMKGSAPEPPSTPPKTGEPMPEPSGKPEAGAKPSPSGNDETGKPDAGMPDKNSADQPAAGSKPKESTPEGQKTEQGAKPANAPSAEKGGQTEAPAKPDAQKSAGEKSGGDGVKPQGGDQPKNGETPAGLNQKSPMKGAGDPSQAAPDAPVDETKAGGKGGQPTAGDPAKTPPARKEDSPDKMPADPQPNGEKSPSSKSEPRDGSPNSEETPPKGEGRKGGQRSDQPQAGEKGGSAQAEEGSSGSRQRGPGESTGRPGEQESGMSPEGKKGGGQPQDGGKPQEGTNGEKSGGEKSGGEKSGGEKSGGEKSGGEKSGGEKSGGEKSGGEKSGGEKSGGEKSGGEKSGGEKSGGEKSGGEKSGGEKSGGEKSGGEKSGGEKAGGEKSGGEKSGGEKSGGEKSGGEKSGGEKAGGEKAGGEKAGGEKAGGEKSGGDSGGDGPPGNQPGQSGSPSGQSQKAGQGGKSGGTGNSSSQSNRAPDSGAPEGAPAGEEADLNAKKQATELVLQKLKNGLERGEVDQGLLEELGWTEDQLQRFVQRMETALQESSQKSEAPAEQARRVQFEEMLKSLDVNRRSGVRSGKEQPSREVDQVDSRRAPVPVEYRRAWEQYTKSLSKTAKSPPK